MKFPSNFQQYAKRFVHDNASLLLTSAGVVGTVATGVLSGRAGLQAGRVLEQDAHANADVEMHPKQQVKLVAPYFVPPVLTGAITIAAIVGANRVSTAQMAALAGAYAVSERNFGEYRSRLEEKLGVKKTEDTRGELQQDRVGRSEDKSIIVLGRGDLLCYDAYSDRYFETSVEKIRKAERVVQHEIQDASQCALSVFYNELDIPQTQFSEHVGFNLNHGCTVHIDTVLRQDQPCLAIEFADLPIWEFEVRY